MKETEKLAIAIKERRLGKVFVGKVYFDNPNQETAIMLKMLFERFIPVHLDCFYHYNKFEYFGYCYDFEPLPEGYSAPEYDIIFHKYKRGKKHKQTWVNRIIIKKAT